MVVSEETEKSLKLKSLKSKYYGLLFWGGDRSMTHADKDYSIIVFFIVFLTGEQNQLVLIKIIQF